MADLFDTPTTPTLRRLLEEVEAGSILIPEFQRPFIWKDQQRLDLLDSVSRGLPIGAFMVWRTRKHMLRCYRNLGPFALPSPSETGPWTYLIDGHQRLTTLFAALSHLDSASAFDTEVRWPIQVDLREDPPQFVLPGRGQAGPHVVPASTLSSNARVYQVQRRLWEAAAESEAQRLEELASRFRDYVVPVIPLVSEDIAQVTHAFARVNRGGTSMSEAHLAAALAYGRIPLRRELQRVAETMSDLGWPALDEGALLNGLKLMFDLDVYRAPTTELLSRLGADSEDEGVLRVALDNLTDGLRWALQELEHAGVCGSASVPYTYQPLVLGVAFAQLVSEPGKLSRLRELVERWFWQTTLTEAFTGATGTTFRRALRGLHQWLSGEDLAQFEQPVRVQDRHSKWGSVRTVARMIALARSTGDGQFTRWLGQLGGQAVHKLVPKLPRDRPGSWVVADVGLLAEAREALRSGLAAPPKLAVQLDHGAWEALAAGDADGFLRIQDARCQCVEEEVIRGCGLTVVPHS